MLLYHSDQFSDHDTGRHPERIQRIVRVNEMLRQEGYIDRCTLPQWQMASSAELQAVHQGDYVSQVQDWCSQDAGRIESDTVVSRGSWSAALLAAGAGLDAVRRVLGGEDKRAFCAIRPPGHHALAAAPMGFCLFNNIAIAAKSALKLGARRVLIVDWDVHHGNGTQDAFYQDSQVGFLSIHRSPFYPGTGAIDETGQGDGLGTNVNIPVPLGIKQPEFFDELRSGLEKLADKMRPELILISAGFDAHREDPVGGLCMENEDYHQLTQIVVEVAKMHCQGRVVSLLEGGYHLDRLPLSVGQHLKALESTG